jgi:formate hydrogenlyase subunit 6/NADH:ubiquinone oxidoreductase subunit I
MAYGLGVAKGMLTTISHIIKPPVTIQYPEERLEMPIWTRGRPRLIYEVDTGDLRCTACGACALACPVDVIKIEQHPSPIKGKVLDRFDIDMAGCIECALCVEACPFRAITMAPDFEMVATFDRTTDLVFDMYELRIAGTAEIDAGMEHIQGVKRGLRGQAAPAAAAPRPAAAAPAAPAARPAPAAPAAAAPAAAPPPAAAPDPPASYDPLTINDDDLKKLPAADRALVYHARLKASGWTPPAAKA